MIKIFYTDICYKKHKVFINGLEKSLSYQFLAWTNDSSLNELILIDQDDLDGKLDALKKSRVLLCYDKKIEKKDVFNTKDSLGLSLLGFLKTSHSCDVYNAYFKNIVNEKKNIDTHGPLSLSSLKNLYEQSLDELERVKKIHKKVVPVRKERFKNISLYSKFWAGTSSGGEVFDMIKCGDHHVIVILASFKSYLGTSILLKNIHELSLKESISKEVLEDFLEDFVNDCREIDIVGEDYQSLQIDLLSFDMSTLKLDIYHFGSSCMIINDKVIAENNCFLLNENNFEQCHINTMLSRGDRMVYFSPGSTFELGRSKINYQELTAELKDENAESFLHEAMFKLRKSTKNDYLEKDTSLLIFEVNNNALIKM